MGGSNGSPKPADGVLGSRSDSTAHANTGQLSPPAAEIAAQLDRILSSSGFARAGRASRFLRYIVQQALDGNPASLKEPLIAMAVFDRDSSYDSKLDSIVRVEAGRLRERLGSYYGTEGQGDAVLIDLPKGSYHPVFSFRGSAPPGHPSPPLATPWRIDRRLYYLATVLGSLLVLAGAAAIHVRISEVPAAAPPLVADPVRITSGPGLNAQVALSPDGRLLAYASDRAGRGYLNIWVQQFTGGEPLCITSDRADDSEPGFAPDGTRIVFRSEREGGGIYSVPVFGGAVRLIAEDGRGPRFSPDGRWIAYWAGEDSSSANRIYLISADGKSEPKRLAAHFAVAHLPAWSPDSRHIIFCGIPGGDASSEKDHDWWVWQIEAGTAVKTGAYGIFRRMGMTGRFSSGSFRPEWAGDHVYFSSTLGDTQGLWRIRIDRRTFKAAHPPQRLTPGTGPEFDPAVTGARLVFVIGPSSTDIWSTRLDIGSGKVLGHDEPFSPASADSCCTSVSADGRRMAYLAIKSSASEIRVRDLDTGLESTPAPDWQHVDNPRLSRDGSRAAFRVMDGKKQPVYVAGIAGTGPEKVCEDCGIPTDWSPDGRLILFETGGPAANLAVLELASRKRVLLTKESAPSVHKARFSPDGRWIAFHAEIRPHVRQLYVMPFRGGSGQGMEGWGAVTRDTGINQDPCWSPDGNLLYYLSERDGFLCIWAQRLDPATKQPAGAPFAVQHLHSARRFLRIFPWMRPLEASLSVAADRILYTVAEARGNIWMAQLPD